ncbi:isochorismatase family protein [Siculibacillus lacustris]|uniref:Isochorismatase family protein n=1 Tax=Siculibacillus lacustris TaxID=1549641 RepID=A0A4Q9VRR4_9HYPH|nr:isochorismatase family protein [Siculibacillus lacustris]TBW37602.1 isochorismatase family protein [Siculibacillus lacustris]
MTSRFARLRLAAFAGLAFAAGPLSAETIVDDWAKIAVPPAPVLSRVTLDPATTALLVLDISKQTCNAQQRPRCIAMLPGVASLLKLARAKGVFVVYTLAGTAKPADILPEAAMLGDEPLFVSGPDKYVDTTLEKTLKDKGIKTVVTIGAAAHGAVLHTAAGSVFRGFDVVVPVDAMASETPYPEQYTAWHLTNAPRMAGKVKLTSVGQID